MRHATRHEQSLLYAFGKYFESPPGAVTDTAASGSGDQPDKSHVVGQLSHPTCDVIRLRNGPLVEFHDKATTSTKYARYFSQTGVEVGP